LPVDAKIASFFSQIAYQQHFEVLQVREPMFTFQKNFINSKIL